MLCQFTFKNFKSYRDETTFDLQAENLKEFQDSLITFEKDKKKLLPVSVLYGPNGGGKSGLLEALSSLLAFVLRPVFLVKYNESLPVESSGTMIIPFKFDETAAKEPTEFEIYFREGKYEFRYNLILYENKIIEEYLYRLAIGGKKPAMIFARYDDKIDLGTELKKAKVSVDVNESMAYLAFLALTYKIEVIQTAFNWFDKTNYIDYSNPTSEIYARINFSYRSDKIVKGLLEMLHHMDIDISGIRLDDDEKLYTAHNIGEKQIELMLEEESQGTIKLIGLLPHLLRALSQGGLMIVDELDAKLHPKLLRYIIKLFTNKETNPHGAQLIFTSHDLSTMKNDLLRRDEIWFAAKDSQNVSRIYSLYDLRDERHDHVKATAAYDKQYLEGRYGADPYLTQMLRWEE